MRIPKLTFWRAVVAFIWMIGLYAAFIRFTKGLGAATNLNDAFPWGIWIGFDILVGVGLAAGGFVITSTIYVFNLKEFKAVSRPTVVTAFLGYLIVIAALLFDLGLPLHVWHPIIHWNPHSVMFEVGWCVMLYTTILALEFSPLVLEKFGLRKPLRLVNRLMVLFVIAGALLSTLHQSSLGTLYVIVPGKLHPLWYSGALPVLFFISSIAAGLAMVIFESYMSARAFGRELEVNLVEKLGRALVLVLALSFVLRLQTLAAGSALKYTFDGSLESILFNAELLLGTVIPIALLMLDRVRTNRAGQFLCAVLVLIGFVMNRLNVSITGMARSSGVNYFPAWSEIAITVSIVSAGFVLFGLAARFLPLYPDRTGVRRSAPPLIAAGKNGRRAMALLFSLSIMLVLGMAYGSSVKMPSKEPSGRKAASRAEDIELRLPGVIEIKMGDESPGQVAFEHATHVDPENPDCVSCHLQEFGIRPVRTGIAGPWDMEAMTEGRQCGSCHNGDISFGVEECEFCHQQ